MLLFINRKKMNSYQPISISILLNMIFYFCPMMTEQFGGIVLCGGKSSRFGSNKGAYVFKNKPLINYSIELLQKFAVDIVVSGPAIVENPIVNFVDDIYLDKGPMGGLHASLSHSQHTFNIVLACDIPFIHASILQKLMDAAKNGFDIVIFQTPDKNTIL